MTVTPATARLTAALARAASSFDIRVGNAGGTTTGPLSVALSGPNAADFSIMLDHCSAQPLARGGSCVVSIGFRLQSTPVADETATLTITDHGAGGSTASVALTGVDISASLTGADAGMASTPVTGIVVGSM